VLHLDALPIAAELLGDDHRRGGHHALPHLDVGRDDRHHVIRADAQERIRLEDRGRIRLAEAEADDERGRSTEQSSALQLHLPPPAAR
jgi:hypothetical protein